MWNWLKVILGNLVAIFKQFIQEALEATTQIAIAEFKDLAIEVVRSLLITDLSNEEKRKEAFENIQDKIKESGKEVGDSVINLLIELALQYVKKNG